MRYDDEVNEEKAQGYSRANDPRPFVTPQMAINSHPPNHIQTYHHIDTPSPKLSAGTVDFLFPKTKSVLDLVAVHTAVFGQKSTSVTATGTRCCGTNAQVCVERIHGESNLFCSRNHSHTSSFRAYTKLDPYLLILRVTLMTVVRRNAIERPTVHPQ